MRDKRAAIKRQAMSVINGEIGTAQSATWQRRGR